MVDHAADWPDGKIIRIINKEKNRVHNPERECSMNEMNKINDEELEGVNGGTGERRKRRVMALADGVGMIGAAYGGGTDTETPAEEKMTWCDTCHTQVRYREFSGGRRKGTCGHWV